MFRMLNVCPEFWFMLSKEMNCVDSQFSLIKNVFFHTGSEDAESKKEITSWYETFIEDFDFLNDPHSFFAENQNLFLSDTW